MLTEKGTTLRRNRRHLLKTDEQFEVEPEIDHDDIDVSSTEQESQVGTEPSCTSSSNVQRSSVTTPHLNKDNKVHPIVVIEQGQDAQSNHQSALRNMNLECCLMFST